MNDIEEEKSAPVVLPKWLSIRKSDGRFIVDPDGCYPEILEAIGMKTPYTQDKLECAFQCMKLEVQRIVKNTELDPRPDLPLQIVVLNRPEWKISNYPEGDGLTTGLKRARSCFIKWRGYIPN